MKYSYTKYVNSNRLQSQIQASNLPPVFWYLETNGEALDIYTTSDLSPEQKGVLDSIVNNHVSIDPSEVIKAKILEAMDFGRSLMAEYGASNVIRGLTVPQVKQIMLITQDLQAALVSGSLYVALDALERIPSPIMDAMDPNVVVITTESITEFRNKIEDYLGIERT